MSLFTPENSIIQRLSIIIIIIKVMAITTPLKARNVRQWCNGPLTVVGQDVSFGGHESWKGKGSYYTTNGTERTTVVK